MATALGHMNYRTLEMYRLYETGATLDGVAIQFGVSRERVRQIFRNAGLPTRSVAETYAIQRDRQICEHDHEICAAYSECKDINEVARRTGVPRPVVTAVVQDRFSKAERRRPHATPKKYSDRELIDCLKQASSALGGVITTAQYTNFARTQRFNDGRPWPTHQTHFHRFGSWRDALHAAGLRSNPTSAISGQVLFEREHCIDALRAVSRNLDKPPTTSEYEICARKSGGALPSLATVRNRCGTWIEALRMADL